MSRTNQEIVDAIHNVKWMLDNKCLRDAVELMKILKEEEGEGRVNSIYLNMYGVLKDD